MSDDFKIQIASIPAYEKVIAEVYYKGEHVAEISCETEEQVNIELFHKPDGQRWGFELAAFQDALSRARKRLVDGG